MQADEKVIPTRNNQRADMLAFFAVFGLIISVFLLFTVTEIPTGNRDLLLVIIGAQIALAKDVYSFEFGSSKGYERSNQALADTAANGNGKPHTP